MTYTCHCGYAGENGWVVARTTRDWAMAQYAPTTGWEYLIEVNVPFPHHRFADGGDAELTPEHHLSCPQCGEDLDESEFWQVEPEEKAGT